MGFQVTEIAGKVELEVRRGCSGEIIVAKDAFYERTEGGVGTYCLIVKTTNSHAVFSLLAFVSIAENADFVSILRPGRPQKDCISHSGALYTSHIYSFTAARAEVLLLPEHSHYLLSCASLNCSTAYVSQYTVNNTLQICGETDRPTLLSARVQAFDYTTSFPILLRAGNTPVTLLESIPLLDRVADYDLQTYLVILVGTLDVVIALTAYARDPDLYLSIGRQNSKPGPMQLSSPSKVWAAVLPICGGNKTCSPYAPTPFLVLSTCLSVPPYCALPTASPAACLQSCYLRPGQSAEWQREPRLLLLHRHLQVPTLLPPHYSRHLSAAYSRQPSNPYELDSSREQF